MKTLPNESEGTRQPLSGEEQAMQGAWHVEQQQGGPCGLGKGLRSNKGRWVDSAHSKWSPAGYL